MHSYTERIINQNTKIEKGYGAITVKTFLWTELEAFGQSKTRQKKTLNF
jgi:hypothetical protein